jgi:hypothetical protein
VRVGNHATRRDYVANLSDRTLVVEAVGMWESRRDFQRVWEAWEAGLMAFHPFHTLSFPWTALEVGHPR